MDRFDISSATFLSSGGVCQLFCQNCLYSWMKPYNSDEDIPEFRNEPCLSQISCFEFVRNMMKISKLPELTMITGLVLLRKLLNMSLDLPFCRLNIYRLYLVAVLLSSKMQDDVTYKNKDWATIGGNHFSLVELNTMEIEMFNCLGYSAVVFDWEMIKFLRDYSFLIPQGYSYDLFVEKVETLAAQKDFNAHETVLTSMFCMIVFTRSTFSFSSVPCLPSPNTTSLPPVRSPPTQETVSPSLPSASRSALASVSASTVSARLTSITSTPSPTHKPVCGSSPSSALLPSRTHDHAHAMGLSREEAPLIDPPACRNTSALQQNCLMSQTVASALLPGVHTQRHASHASSSSSSSLSSSSSRNTNSNESDGEREREGLDVANRRRERVSTRNSMNRRGESSSAGVPTVSGCGGCARSRNSTDTDPGSGRKRSGKTDDTHT